MLAWYTNISPLNDYHEVAGISIRVIWVIQSCSFMHK